MTEQDIQPWAGFWRRVGAFVIDCLVIGVVGFALGALAFDAFARMGQWARIVGILIAALYFGVLGSSVGGGQTLGKRLLKLRVERQGGGLLAIGPAVGRALILMSAFILNGIALRSDGGAATYVFLIVAATLLFGLGLAQAYLLIFNRPSRRLVHDLLLNSVVLRAGASAADAPVAVLHRRIAVGVVGVVFVLITGITVYFAHANSGMIASMKSPLSAVEALPEVMTVNLGENTSVMVSSQAGKTTTHTLVINARVNALPKDQNAEAVRIARAALAAYRPKPGQGVAVTTRYGFDMGIASGWRNYTTRFPPPVPAPPGQR